MDFPKNNLTLMSSGKTQELCENNEFKVVMGFFFGLKRAQIAHIFFAHSFGARDRPRVFLKGSAPENIHS